MSIQLTLPGVKRKPAPDAAHGQGRADALLRSSQEIAARLGAQNAINTSAASMADQYLQTGSLPTAPPPPVARGYAPLPAAGPPASYAAPQAAPSNNDGELARVLLAAIGLLTAPRQIVYDDQGRPIRSEIRR